MRLRAFVAVEIAAQFRSERDDAEQFARCEQVALFAGVEILDDAPQLGKIGADPLILVHRAHRAVEESVRLPSGLGNFGTAHVGDKVDALAEFGAVDVLRDKVVDEPVDLFGEFRFLLDRQRYHARRAIGRDDRNGVGRGELELLHRIGSGDVCVLGCRFLRVIVCHNVSLACAAPYWLCLLKWPVRERFTSCFVWVIHPFRDLRAICHRTVPMSCYPMPCFRAVNEKARI